MPSCFFSILGIDASLKQKCFPVEHTAPPMFGRFCKSTTTELCFLFGRSASSLLFCFFQLQEEMEVTWSQICPMCWTDQDSDMLIHVLGHVMSVIFIRLLNCSLSCHTMLCTLTILVIQLQ
jgi:hypothetical protein